MTSYLYQAGSARSSDPNALASGESTIPRYSAGGGVTLSSGLMRLAYFTANKTETINTVRMATSSTAAAPTPTIIRIGIYSVAANGDLTLVASTANDLTLFAATQTVYSKALSAQFSKVAGTRYAAGALVVTGAAAPLVYGVIPLLAGEIGQDPKLGATQGGLADLPANSTNAQAGASNLMPYVAMVP